MSESARYERALAFATEKHRGQYRIGGLPYITHPMAVAELVREAGYGEDYQIAGLFHDLLEDTNATPEEIEAIGGADVLDAVQRLTKKKGYVMADYVAGILACPMAKAVKAADRLHNLRCAVETDQDFRRRYILESIDWYLDFSPEIPKAVRALTETLDAPLRSLPLEYQPVAPEELTVRSFAVKGDICWSAAKDRLETIKDGYLVSVDGVCRGAFRELPEEYRGLKIFDYSGRLIIPGLVDLHIHAPQFAFRGMGMDLTLFDWLQQNVFPEEAKYQDPTYAERAYSIFAESLRRSATTHACIFATCHRTATEILMQKMEQSGLVSFVGKVNMDRDAPSNLREANADHAAFDTFGFLNHIAGKFQRTKPILTPRFLPSCSRELLDQLSEIQRAYDLPVQSHLSETKDEVALVHERFPEAAFYADAYDHYGLLGRARTTLAPVRTIMAHCVYSTDEEAARLQENGVFVAHCPTSNTDLCSGIAPIRKYLDRGMQVGLGSDVAGGHTESMLRVACSAIECSKHYSMLVDSACKPLTFPEAFYLATRGGGAFFGNVGSFEAGAEFHAVVLDDSGLQHPFALTLAQRLERAAYSALDLYGIQAKFVNGELLFDRTKEGGGA